MNRRALSIPETVQQRRRRYERIAAKVSVAVGVASCRREKEHDSFVVIGAALYVGKNGMKFKY